MFGDLSSFEACLCISRDEWQISFQNRSSLIKQINTFLFRNKVKLIHFGTIINNYLCTWSRVEAGHYEIEDGCLSYQLMSRPFSGQLCLELSPARSLRKYIFFFISAPFCFIFDTVLSCLKLCFVVLGRKRLKCYLILWIKVWYNECFTFYINK